MAETKFSPTKDFYSEELGSQYIAGLVYTIRDQRTINGGGEEVLVPAEKTPLARLAKGWVAKGLVVLVPSPSATHLATIKGKGTVN